MKLKSILLKYHNYFLVTAFVLLSVAISIRSKDGEVIFIFGEYPVLIFFMVLLSSFLFVIYIQTNKTKLTSLSEQIKDQSKDNNTEINSLLDKLTERQREVYDLIVSGKTNKEIMAQLFIEQSTLKSHINQIYRKLNINNRRELKSKITKNHQE